MPVPSAVDQVTVTGAVGAYESSDHRTTRARDAHALLSQRRDDRRCAFVRHGVASHFEEARVESVWQLQTIRGHQVAVAEQLRGRAVGNDRPVVEDDRSLTQLERVREVVRDHERGELKSIQILLGRRPSRPNG